MDMLRWADEQSEARRLARQTPSPPVQETPKLEAYPCEKVEKPDTSDLVVEDNISPNDDDVINEVTPVPSWCDFDQPTPSNDGTKDVTPVPSWCDFDQPLPSNDGSKEVTRVPSWCDFEQEMPVTVSLQEMEGFSFLDSTEKLEEGKDSGLIAEDIKTPCAVGKETIGIENTVSFNALPAIFQETRVNEKVRESDDLDELMSVLQDIPELEPDYVFLPASNSTTEAVVNPEVNPDVPNVIGQNCQLKPTNIVHFEAQSATAVTSPKQNMLEEHEHLQQINHSAERVDIGCQEPIEKVENHEESICATGQAAVYPYKKEQMSKTTKPVLRDLHKLKEIQSTVKESLKEVIAGIIKESPLLETTSLPKILPKPEYTQTKHEEFLHAEAYKQSASFQQTQKSRHTEESQLSGLTQKICDAPRTLVGSDKPHVYERRILKRKQHGASSVTQNMTAGEILEYEKRRDEALQAVELKKQRTKLLLNQQFEKSSQKNPSLHYYKVQNTPKLKSFSKSASVPTRPSTNNKNNQIYKSSADSAAMLGSSSIASRKRPATSINTGTAAKRARSSRPRIILRIFRDEDDWNVEQVIDRY